jgi:hypothetical protein
MTHVPCGRPQIFHSDHEVVDQNLSKYLEYNHNGDSRSILSGPPKIP